MVPTTPRFAACLASLALLAGVAGCAPAAANNGSTFAGGQASDAGGSADGSVKADAASQPRTGQGKYPTKNAVHKGGGGGKWTILLYSMADTDLETYMLDDILEMAEVGSGPSLNLVVQVDRAAGVGKPGYTDKALGNAGDFTTTKRFKVVKGGFEELADLGEKARTKPSELADFIQWGVKAYPADRYALILSDHGGGYVGIGPDDSTGDHDLLDLGELRDGLADGLAAAGLERFDLIGFDACLMATIEVALAVRPFAEYLLASEETEPGFGWDYRNLQLLAATPGTSAEQLGKHLIAGYAQHAKDHQQDDAITLSLVDLHALEPLVEALDALAAVGGAALDTAGLALGKARGGARAFGKQGDQDTGQVDLGQLATLAAKQTPALQAASAALDQALKKAVLASHHGKAQEGVTGLSIYFPAHAKAWQASYESLDFMVGWRSFVQGLFAWATQNAAASQPDFSQAGDKAQVTENEGSVVVQAALAAGDGKGIVEAALYVAVADAASQAAFVFLALPAQVADDAVAGAWPKLVGLLGQGSEKTPAFMALAEVEGLVVADVPVQFTPQGGTAVQGFVRFTLDATGQPVDVPTLYVVDGDVIGAVEAEAGDTVQPMVLKIDASGAASWVATGPALAAAGTLTFSLQPYTAPDPVLLILEVTDLVGQSDTVVGSWTPPAP